MNTAFQIEGAEWVVLAACGLLVGASKTGLPGLGILVVPLFASVLPARLSTGILLPLLIFADCFAVVYYRRHAVWTRLWPLLPWTFLGIVVGALALGRVSDSGLGKFIGALVLVLLGLNHVRRRMVADDHIPDGRWFAGAIGFMAGVTTMMANAAGPIMIIYLLAMRLPKTAFIGTGAWFFFIVNSVKVPFSAGLGLIRADTLLLDLALAPVVALGAFVGIWCLKRIPERLFATLVEVLAAAAALRLLLA